MELKRRLFGREGGRGFLPLPQSGRIPCGKSAAAESCYQDYWLILNVMMMIMQMRMLQALLVGKIILILIRRIRTDGPRLRVCICGER